MYVRACVCVCVCVSVYARAGVLEMRGRRRCIPYHEGNASLQCIFDLLPGLGVVVVLDLGRDTTGDGEGQERTESGISSDDPRGGGGSPEKNMATWKERAR